MTAVAAVHDRSRSRDRDPSAAVPAAVTLIYTATMTMTVVAIDRGATAKHDRKHGQLSHHQERTGARGHAYPARLDLKQPDTRGKLHGLVPTKLEVSNYSQHLVPAPKKLKKPHPHTSSDCTLLLGYFSIMELY